MIPKTLETITVVHSSGKGLMVINKKDFNPKIHKLPTAKRTRKKADAVEQSD